jgi:hypothetical protein
MKTVTAVGIIFLLFLCSCSENSGRESIGNITVDFVWDLKHPQRSPEIHLKNTPKGTKRFHIEFIDATNEWEHGGGSITNDDTGIIRAGALKEFKGLSSTWGTPKIRLSVVAFNKDGHLIGKGEIVKRPPDD